MLLGSRSASHYYGIGTICNYICLHIHQLRPWYSFIYGIFEIELFMLS
jgi:hypothetical protein